MTPANSSSYRIDILRFICIILMKLTTKEVYVGLALISHNPAPQTVRSLLSEKLRVRNLRIKDVILSTLHTWDLKHDVLYIGGRSEQPFCLIPDRMVGRLLGNAPLRECPMTISCFRSAGKSIPSILSCGAFDGINVSYAGDNFAVAVDAQKFLELMR
jgi:hypothetical protein